MAALIKTFLKILVFLLFLGGLENFNRAFGDVGGGIEADNPNVDDTINARFEQAPYH